MHTDTRTQPAASPHSRKPVSLLTGFLGSGKTTLLRRMLADPALSRAAVIVNEFGDTDFNDVALGGSAIDVVAANAGCFCCNGRAQLVTTLKNLEAADAQRPFDRVLIETSGLSDPAPVLQVIINDVELVDRYRIEAVVTVVDAVTGLENLDTRPEARRQVALADRVVLTKTDVADRRETELVCRRIATLNPHVPILDAADAEFLANELLLASPGALERRSEVLDVADAAAHPEAVATWTIRTQAPATEAGLALWMDLMAAYRGRHVLRMKGIIDVAGAPVLVESVRHVFHPPVRLEAWPTAERGSRVVVIAQGIDRPSLERAFEALAFEPLREALDPDGYARFRALVRHFSRTPDEPQR